MKRKAAGVVVDASVARAAGDSSSANSAKSAVAALVAIRDSDVCVVTSRAVMSEWKKHQSNFSRKWFYNMVATKRVVRVYETPLSELRSATAKLPDPTMKMVMKDWHLVETAHSSCQRVISGDVRIRDQLAMMGDEAPCLKQLYWAVPGENCVAWVEAGLPHGPEWSLCTSPPWS